MAATTKGAWARMVAAWVVGAAACAPAGTVDLARGGESGPGAVTAQRAALIHDGARGGTPGFFFLPPLVPRPGNFGPEVPSVEPTVTIDRFDAQGRASQAVAVFTLTSGPFDEHIRRHLAGAPPVDDDGDLDPDGFFVARWRTALFAVSPGDLFRIRVLAGGRQLGLADVQVVGTRRQFREVDRNQLVPLIDDNVLRIKFRIERAAVDRDGDGVFDWADNCLVTANADQADSVGDGVGDACRCAVSDEPAPGPAGRMYALTIDPAGILDGFTAAPSALEIADLTTFTPVRTLPTGNRSAFAMEVSADGGRAYLPDRTGYEITVVDTVCGTQRAGIGVQGARDMVLAPGGADLYVSGLGGIFDVDTATNAIKGLYPTADITSPLGLALSPDGGVVAAVTTDAGSRQAVALLDARHGLAELAVIPMVSDLEGCDAFPNDAVFASNDRLLVWDSNCDVLYQIDVAAGVQVREATIETGRDLGSSFDFNEALVYSAGTGRALAFKEVGDVVAIDPVAGTSSVVSTHPELSQPFGLVISPDGATTYPWIVNFDQDLPNALDRIDNATLASSPGVYSFADATRWVRSARVVVPRPGP